MANIKERPPTSALDDLKPQSGFTPGKRRVRLPISADFSGADTPHPAASSSFLAPSPEGKQGFATSPAPAAKTSSPAEQSNVRIPEVDPTTCTQLQITPNLEKIQLEPGGSLENTTVGSIDSLESIEILTRDNPGIIRGQSSCNIETTERHSRDALEAPKSSSESISLLADPSTLQASLENTQRVPRENLETTCDDYRNKPREPRDVLSETQRQPGAITRDSSRDNPEKTTVEPKDGVSFSRLVGLQRSIAIFIYEETKRVRDKVTDEITSLHLSEACQTSITNVQNGVKELVKKQVLSRAEFKVGRGGWTRYELAEHIYQQMAHFEAIGKLRGNLEKTPPKHGYQTRDQSREGASSSSSSLVNKIISPTTTENNTGAEPSLPSTWESIDYSPLRTLVHFGRSQIVDIYRAAAIEKFSDGLTADQVQESIYEFHYDLVENKKSFRAPLNALVGILRNKNQYRAPGYVSEFDQLLADQARIALEKEAERNQRYQELYEIEYRTWRLELTPQQIREYAPAALESKSITEGGLQNYFEKNVYPEKRQSSSERAKTAPGATSKTIENEPSLEDCIAAVTEGLGGTVDELDRSPSQ